jgi:pimeloyl-ACP methyl ester carboxylesterase
MDAATAHSIRLWRLGVEEVEARRAMNDRPAALRFVQANGLRFAYLEEGEGPLVLLIHGFPDTPHTWDAVRPALAEAGYRAVSPFTRGYAPTEIPKEEAYDPDTLGRDVLALIEALGAKRAIVIGHDWGASAAYSAASLDPARVELLVTLAIPHPASIRPSPSLLWSVRHFLTLRPRGAAAGIRARDFADIDMLVRRWSPAWDVPPDETAAVKAAFREPGCLEAALGYYHAITVRPPRSLRQRITVPAVSFAGGDDILPQAAFDRAAPWYTAGYRVIRMPGGHFMHREHPARFNQELLDVLAHR